MKEVRLLMPDNASLEYMSRQDRMVVKYLVPKKVELQIAADSVQSNLNIIKNTNEAYKVDSEEMKQLSKTVTELPVDRKVRNNQLICNDLVYLVERTNITENILLNTHKEYEKSMVDLKKTLLDVCQNLKQSQLDTYRLDFEFLKKSDKSLSDLLHMISMGCESAGNQLAEVLVNLDLRGHKQVIQDEYEKRNLNNYIYEYDSRWKPFSTSIQETFEQEKSGDEYLVKKLKKSFTVLLECIEYSINMESIEKTVYPIINNMKKMKQIILSKQHEIEYNRYHFSDCNYSTTSKSIEFLEYVFNYLSRTISETFESSVHHERIEKVLKNRNEYITNLRSSFKGILEKITATDTNNHFVREYWETVSGVIYDFIERVYSSNDHQKREVIESIKKIVKNLKEKANELANYIDEVSEHIELDPKIDLYERNIVERYNSIISNMKKQYESLDLYNRYDVMFAGNTINIDVHEKLGGNSGTLENKNEEVLKTSSYVLGIEIEPSPGSLDKPFRINKTAPDASKELLEEINKKYKYMASDGKYNWVRSRTFNLDGLTMDDYINLFVRKRCIRFEGGFYDDFNSVMMHIGKEKPIKLEPYDPPIETEICQKGYGRTNSSILKEVPMKLKIPFFPPTFESNFKSELFLVSPVHLLNMGRTDSKGVPGSDAFHVLNCIEVKEIKVPDPHVTVNMSYCLVFTGSTIVEGVIKENVPKEVAFNFGNAEDSMKKVMMENNPDSPEKDPNKKVESNNPFDIKIQNSARFKNISKDGKKLLQPESELSKEGNGKKKKHKYLGNYDKRAPYLSRPEYLNEDFEDIFNTDYANDKKTGKKEKYIEYIDMLKDKNLGLISEMNEMNKIVYANYSKDPNKIIQDIKEKFDSRQVQLMVIAIAVIVVLYITDY